MVASQALGAATEAKRVALTLLIELDGLVLDVAAVHYRLHRSIAAAVGWSALDQATFWRLTRTKGREAVLLPGARPAKIKEYFTRFDEQLEGELAWDECLAHPAASNALTTCQRFGKCMGISLATNVAVRQKALNRTGLARHFGAVQSLSLDPRVRAGELHVLAVPKQGTIVVAATDAIIRAAGSAELVSVGIPTGTCTPARLHQAGADAAFGDLREFAQCLDSGAHELIQAGLPPSAFF